ncbi:MAG TPA: hypothetical protein RMH99_16980 [Sandaracinaceae bacterium LLY-WYZ-13_1]|nr:hypothetical protein [Sandaracinaceae bacterium LLY-WYZ-13_1]
MHGDGVTPVPPPESEYASASTELAVGPDDRVYMAYKSADESGVYEITSEGFELLGDRRFPWAHGLALAAVPTAPSSVVLAVGVPHGTQMRPTFHRWDGSSWEDLGRRLTVSPGVPLELIAEEDSFLFATYTPTTRDESSTVPLLRRDGDGWETLATVSRDGGAAVVLSRMVSDGMGRPVIETRYNGRDGATVDVLRWSGTDWEPLLSAAPFEGRPGLVPSVSGDVARVILHDGRLEVEIYEAGAWTRVGAPSPSPGRIPLAAIDRNGVPHVAWSSATDGGDSRFHLACWNGSRWLELGEPRNAHPADAGLGGATDSRDMSLAFTADGSVWLAWSEEREPATPERVHLWRYTR